MVSSLLQQSNCGILSFLHDAAFSPVTYAYFITVEYIANAVAALIAHQEYRILTGHKSISCFDRPVIRIKGLKIVIQALIRICFCDNTLIAERLKCSTLRGLCLSVACEMGTPTECNRCGAENKGNEDTDSLQCFQECSPLFLPFRIFFCYATVCLSFR